MFRRLIEDGYLNIHKLLLKEQQRLGLKSEEVILLSALSSLIEKKKNTVSITALSKTINDSVSNTGDLFTDLIKRGFITTELELKADGKEKEVFTLEPLFDKIKSIFEAEMNQQKESKNESDIVYIIQAIEKAFGRALSAFDLEMVKEWFTESFTKPQIENAIQVTLNHHKKTVSYIDRVLRSDDLKPSELDDKKKAAIDKLIRGIK
ncbi:DnaD domain protein [Acholeplasma manati]|uniref:DnaD domain protein n=1 Tax=Paracholeplasma manati TaxID=591373 RepID=A0ABT2YBK3_9MOLU|nr:DnaD domain protein [Paracholeplasma manati]MCV2231723.1 DnaD domain protein [Paracholeplasma manati]